MILSWCYVLCSHLFLQALSSWPHLSMLFQGFYLYLCEWAWGFGVLFCSSFGRAGSWDVLNLELGVSELQGSWLTSGCLQREARVRGGGGGAESSSESKWTVCFSEELSWLCLKSKGWIGGQHPWNWEAKIQAAKHKNKARTKQKTLPASVLRLYQLWLRYTTFQVWKGISQLEQLVPGAVLSSGEQGVCVPVGTVHLATCAHRPVFTSQSQSSVLVTHLWWIAEHWTCGTRLSSAPSCLPQSILSEKSHSFLNLLHSPAVHQLELTWGYFWYKLRENLCGGPKESPLHACPVAALSFVSQA